MDINTFKDDYIKLYETVLAEHEQVFQNQNLDELRETIEEIIKADRVFIMGVGREGIAARGFAMRLMHLGKETHWIWDDTTSGMGENDLFIAVNGSGKIGHIHYVVEQAKNTGARILVVTGNPNEKTPLLADKTLFVPAAVFNGTDTRCIESIQPMGNLFEQHLFLLFDMIIMLSEKDLNLSHELMEKRHRNIE